ncbi:hypothetical protein OUZ56_026571 [Daphnia magna]|uniref:Uncharacterized protein n=1 Tax=Daphnia magna TaxID=35525 RepID=A0ABQ9ZM69_9CRUS|nr:hypothetical protein OUZ56_026571 [Daphnia magna]
MLRLQRLRGQEAPPVGQLEKQTLSPRNTLQRRLPQNDNYHLSKENLAMLQGLQHAMTQLASAVDDLEKESRIGNFGVISESTSLSDRSFNLHPRHTTSCRIFQSEVISSCSLYSRSFAMRAFSYKTASVSENVSSRRFSH